MLTAQVAVQCPISLFVRQNVLVNPFVAEGKTFALEDSRDLLWAEVLAQVLLNICPYFWVDALFLFGLPFLASLFCLPVAVTTRPSISGKFAAYGRDVTAYLFGHRPQGRTTFHGLINIGS